MKDDVVNWNKDVKKLGLNLKPSQNFCNNPIIKSILKSNKYSQRSALASIYNDHKKEGKRDDVKEDMVNSQNIKYEHKNMVQSFNNYDKVKKSRLMLERIMVTFSI